MRKEVEIVIEPEADPRERQTFRSALKDFGVELISGGNYDEPFVIPSCIIPNGHPILVMKQFMELHEYSPRSVAVKTPVSSNDYIQFVDQKTYALFKSNPSLMKSIPRVKTFPRPSPSSGSQTSSGARNSEMPLQVPWLAFTHKREGWTALPSNCRSSSRNTRWSSLRAPSPKRKTSFTRPLNPI